MDEATKTFLEKVEIIRAKKPSYKLGADGSGSTCDCIGLIIGAIRRMGLEWSGIHGSNWTARRGLVCLQKITNVMDLQVGDVVLKARNKTDKNYKLPDRYKINGAYYDGDLKDYYHAGVVTSVSPLQITHMTSPTVKVDTSLGKWSHHGTLKILAKAAGQLVPVAPITAATIATPTTGSIAIVTAPSGNYVKMRQQASTRCTMWEEIPVGAHVTLVSPGEEWAKINYGRRKGWYMMAKFLDVAS